eukprot:CAMPEP_0185464960 /NCGR_PEP_ID=MMETSP1365-20130426/95991_1 /TAXON_ID=38817 /ORGANISM="Gephyrocapsa oceanica, Strain RCC1303" /LENGTH=316 /DNA_ID=CAMNT_0028071695 /DNA_START=24 /DNA_END=976 /DNA_ORIENTATION=-
MNEPATDLPVALLQGTGAALVAITLSAPLASTAGVAAIAGPLRRVLPGAASVLHAFAAGCQRLRARDKLFVASHAMITYACGDLLVQLASHTGGGPISYAPLRTLRNSAAGIISDALPFYYWSSLLAGVGSTTARPLSWARDCRAAGIISDALPFYYWSSLLAGVGSTTDALLAGPEIVAMAAPYWHAVPPTARRARADAIRIPIAALVSGVASGDVAQLAAALIALKVALHIVLFQTVSNALYLASHALLSRSGWRGAITRVRRSLWQTCLVAAVSFGIGGPLVYMLPSVLLQSALRNVGVLGFSSYLALVANSG